MAVPVKRMVHSPTLHIPVLPTHYTHLCLSHHILHNLLHCHLMETCHLHLPPTHPWICPLRHKDLQHPHLLHPPLPRHHHLAPLWHRLLHNPLCHHHPPLALLHQTSPPLLGHAFGYMNMVGIIIQILLPCSAPWYKLIHGLTPANYSMKGSPGGLAHINALFHSHMYTVTFTNGPILFGAFPSLHAGCMTIEALCLSHFFPATTKYVWAYTGVLYWATMYLSHHYLINIVGGTCLATTFIYLFLQDDLRGSAALMPLPHLTSSSWFRGRSKHEVYNLEGPCRGGRGGEGEGWMGWWILWILNWARWAWMMRRWISCNTCQCLVHLLLLACSRNR